MTELPKLPRLPTQATLRPNKAKKPSKANPKQPHTLGGTYPSIGDITGYPNGLGGGQVPRS